MAHFSATGLVCPTDKDECNIPNSFCDSGNCLCHTGYKYVNALKQCIPAPQFGLRCLQHRSCRIWDRNMACDAEIHRCVCSYRYAYDEASQTCQTALNGLCPSGYKWNSRVANCEGRGRYRGGDKMIDVIIVFVFFVILLLVIRKWKPAYQGLDRDLNWPLRGLHRENPATVLFISAARPSLLSNSNPNLRDNDQSHSTPVPLPPPHYNSISDSNIFEPQEPPPTYEEAMAMTAASSKASGGSGPSNTALPSRQSDQGPSSSSRRQLQLRRDSDDPFEV